MRRGYMDPAMQDRGRHEGKRGLVVSQFLLEPVYDGV
jgi:hypothetical protein